MATIDPAQESLRHWTAVAPAWDRYRNHLFASTRGVSERIVERAEVAPGTTLLELTAGPGDTGFLAAERLGGDGRLISSDFVEEMVESARREGTQRGLTNVDYRVIDATQIDLGDASVDGVISRFGLMLVPEQQRAMAEIRRVLRPGGRLAYGTWGPPDRNPWLFQIVMALLGVGIAPPGDPFAPGGVFSLATEEANRALVESAGFEDVGVDEVTGSMRFDSIDDYWTVNTAVAGPIADLVATLDTERLAQARASLAESIAPFRDGDAVELPWVALVTAAS